MPTAGPEMHSLEADGKGTHDILGGGVSTARGFLRRDSNIHEMDHNIHELPTGNPQASRAAVFTAQSIQGHAHTTQLYGPQIYGTSATLLMSASGQSEPETTFAASFEQPPTALHAYH